MESMRENNKNVVKILPFLLYRAIVLLLHIHHKHFYYVCLPCVYFYGNRRENEIKPSDTDIDSTVSQCVLQIFERLVKLYFIALIQSFTLFSILSLSRGPRIISLQATVFLRFYFFFY